MTEDIWVFLSRFALPELIDQQILHPNGSNYHLNRYSVYPLVDLMRRNGTTKLEKAEFDWLLTSSYEFNNLLGKDAQTGDARKLNINKRGSVFTRRNKDINPFFDKRNVVSNEGMNQNDSRLNAYTLDRLAPVRLASARLTPGRFW